MAISTQYSDQDGSVHKYFLDIDLYKLVNQWAVLKFFANVDVTWKFTSRSPEFLFTEAGFHTFKTRMQDLEHVTITPKELDYLREACPYFPQQYLDYLSSFKYNPDCLEINFDAVPPSRQGQPSERILGEISITAQGKWCETVLFESVVLHALAEIYNQSQDGTWDYGKREENAYQNAAFCIQNGIKFADFGSRRRHSLYGHEKVIKGLHRAQSEFGHLPGAGEFLGTSNVHLSRLFGLKPQGTMSHEWFMGVGACIDDYTMSTQVALAYWIECYGPWFNDHSMFGLALPDTFGSELFWKFFGEAYHSRQKDSPLDGKPFCDIFTGLRNDSGDSVAFTRSAKEWYSLHTKYNLGDTKGSNPQPRPILMFSESLNPRRCLDYDRLSRTLSFDCLFAMGKSLTKDLEDDNQGLNIVFKLHTVGGNSAVKLSDVIGKAVGDQRTIERITGMTTYKKQTSN